VSSPDLGQDEPGRALSPSDVDLVDRARACAAASHRGDDTYTVAAALRLDDGEVVVGMNVHHFTGGPCAEPVALGAARAATSAAPAVIVAVDADGEVLAPCGRCRQQLLDLTPDIDVIVPTHEALRRVPVSSTLPWAYRNVD
jgi:cytidine deaminase